MFINKELLEFAKAGRKSFLRFILLDIIETLVGTLSYIGISLLILSSISENTHSNLYSILSVSILGICLICGPFIMRSRCNESTAAGIGIKNNLRICIMKNILFTGPSFFLGRTTGQTIDTIWSRVEWLDYYYTRYLPALFSTVINSLFICAVLMHFHKYLVLTALTILTIIFLIPLFFKRILEELGKAEIKTNSELYRDTLDFIRGIFTLKTLNAEKVQLNKIKLENRKYHKTVMRNLSSSICLNIMQELLIRGGNIIFLLISLILFYRGEIKNIELICTFFLSLAFFIPVLKMVNGWHMGFKGITGSAEIEKIMNSNSSELKEINILHTKKISSCKRKGTEVLFQNVNFRYGENFNYTLEDINLKLNPNTVTAVIGRSGSGKTTLAMLLSGFYSPESGGIYINGKINGDNTQNYTDTRCSAVWQDSYVFYCSCFENIAMESVTNKHQIEKIYNSAEISAIDETLRNLKNSYNSFPGENGRFLSGGERQRLLLARSLYQDSPLIILDEATSSLDRENGNYIQKQIAFIKRRATVLIIAHTPEMTMDADEIIIMDNGKIVESGTPDELQIKSRFYREFIHNQ